MTTAATKSRSATASPTIIGQSNGVAARGFGSYISLDTATELSGPTSGRVVALNAPVRHLQRVRRSLRWPLKEKPMSGHDQDADALRAEAQRARRLAATLSQPAHRAREVEYARELERRADQAQRQ